MPLIFGCALFLPGSSCACTGSRESTSQKTEISRDVEGLISQLGELLVRGQATVAYERAEQALQRFRQTDDRHGQATCLSFLGIQDSGAGETEKALERFESSLALLIDLDRNFQAAAAARLLGSLLLGNGRLEEAEQRVRRGLDLLKAFEDSEASIPDAEYWLYASMLGLPPDLSDLSDPFSEPTRRTLVKMAEGTLRDALGEILTWQQRLDEAETELQRALDLSIETKNRWTWRVLVHLGILRQDQGRYDESRSSLWAALAALESRPPGLSATKNRRERIGVFELLARVERAEGKPEEGLIRNEQALESARDIRDAIALAMLLKNRADLLQAKGDYAGAREILGAARESAFDVGDPYLEARVLTKLAIHALAIGSYEFAASYLEQTLPRLETSGDEHAELMAWALLATSYQGLGALERAERAVDEARDLTRRIHFPEGRLAALVSEAVNEWHSEDRRSEDVLRLVRSAFDDPQMVFRKEPSRRLLMEVALLVNQEADPEEIAKAAAAASEKARQTGQARDEAVARTFLGHAYRQRGRLNLARQEWGEALRISRQLGFRHLEASVLTGLADLAWDAGRRDEAVEQILEAVEVFETTLSDVRVDELLIPFLAGQMSLYHRAITALVETGQPSAAFAYSERARARALQRLLANQRLRSPDQLAAALATELEVRRREISDLEERLADSTGTAADRFKNELESVWRRYEDLIVRIRLVEPEAAELVSVDPVDLETVQQELLGPEVTLISFFVRTDHVVAWVIDRDGSVYVPTKMTRQDFEEISCLTPEIARHRRQRGARRLAQCRPLDDLSTDLYKKLLSPLMPHVRHRNLILVPHDALHHLPLAALRDPESGRYLIEDYTLTYVPSAGVLRFLRKKASPMEGRALVLGDPELTDETLPRLTGAEREAQAVARLFDTEPLVGPDAMESRVHDLDGRIDILHLAAHGVYRSENPRFSYLALAEGDGHDGRLAMHEIFEDLDLKGVNLVVLSACQTALGERSQGDEIVGLIRAFLYAGSPAVMATLWNVDDEVSALLMEHFYRRLLEGMPAAEALRQAQLEMLRRQATKAPYYWAGFSLVGEPGQGY